MHISPRGNGMNMSHHEEMFNSLADIENDQVPPLDSNQIPRSITGDPNLF
jgi:hypothetical protein